MGETPWAYIPLSYAEAQRLYQVALEYQRSVHERFNLLIAEHGVSAAERVLTNAAGEVEALHSQLWSLWGKTAFPATDHKRASSTGP